MNHYLLNDQVYLTKCTLLLWLTLSVNPVGEYEKDVSSSECTVRAWDDPYIFYYVWNYKDGSSSSVRPYQRYKY